VGRDSPGYYNPFQEGLQVPNRWFWQKDTKNSYLFFDDLHCALLKKAAAAEIRIPMAESSVAPAANKKHGEPKLPMRNPALAVMHQL